MQRSAVVAALASARALVASLEAALEAAEAQDGDLLDAKAAMRIFGVGRDGLVAAAKRGELALSRGPRNRVLVERQELTRWLKARTHEPRRKLASAKPVPANDLAAWEAQAERELLAMGGG